MLYVTHNPGTDTPTTSTISMIRCGECDQTADVPPGAFGPTPDPVVGYVRPEASQYFDSVDHLPGCDRPASRQSNGDLGIAVEHRIAAPVDVALPVADVVTVPAGGRGYWQTFRQIHHRPDAPWTVDGWLEDENGVRSRISGTARVGAMVRVNVDRVDVDPFAGV